MHTHTDTHYKHTNVTIYTTGRILASEFVVCVSAGSREKSCAVQGGSGGVESRVLWPPFFSKVEPQSDPPILSSKSPRPTEAQYQPQI